MIKEIDKSAIEFTKMWCNLFVGDNPNIKKAIQYFDEGATIIIPNVPFRISRDEDEEEIHFSHIVDGRGHIHFWQVIEPKVIQFGDFSVVTYYARYNIGRKGDSVVKCAKETLVLVKNKDANDWKILHMHNSTA
jgi:ketosteroid isomerase-like protein